MNDLGSVIDIEPIRSAKPRLAPIRWGARRGVLGAHRGDDTGFRLEVVDETVDPTFRFMRVDWDGKIRMDCSSPYAMAGLIALKDRFDVAFACDTDRDRHGIVTRSAGLLNPNHYLAVAIIYLFANRPGWRADAGVGKTLVSEQHDRSRRDEPRPAAGRGAGRVQVVRGRTAATARWASAARRAPARRSCGGTATVWTTDKDGLIMGLLSAEMLARTGKDPGEMYRELTRAVRRAGVRAHRRSGHPGAEGDPVASCRRSR